jgi:4-hydroxyphenylpyruvate dioxygenase
MLAVALACGLAYAPAEWRTRTPPPRLSGAPSTIIGADAFVRTNPVTDRFQTRAFHHVELYCSDASSTAGRFAHALGMDVIATSGPHTGNSAFASVVVGSGDVRLCFTAPLSPPPRGGASGGCELADALGYDAAAARSFIEKHGGVAVRAVCVHVADARAAYDACVAGGGEGVLSPRPLHSTDSSESHAAAAEVAEVRLYGDVALRLLSINEAEDSGGSAYLPGWADATSASGSGGGKNDESFGIARFDHIVGNVWELLPTVRRLHEMLGFHEFAEFASEDVGTIDSGLNSIVMSNDAQNVLLPVNEPTYGTRRRSQIETYLVSNGGEGVQHIALFSKDIFETIRKMRAAGERGGFVFMDAPSDEYYEELPARIGDALTKEEYATVRELGLLVDRDPEGVLIQIFTRPVGDRPTLFLEIIERRGCMLNDETAPELQVQRGGCGGFGKGNFKELFKSVEKYEATLDIDAGTTSGAGVAGGSD